MQHCTDLPRQVTFPVHTKQGKTGQGLGSMLPLIRRSRRMRRRARERQEKREDRPILKRLRATLLRWFRGLHGEKMVCVRGVPGVTGTHGVGDRTTTFRRLLIGAVQFCSLYMYILNVRQKFRASLSKKIGDNTSFGDGQKVRNDD